MSKYIVTRDFKSPYVVATGMAHKPQRIEYKTFKKGQIISGKMQTSNGRNAFVLVNGVLPVDLSNIKEVVARDLNSEAQSSADGSEVASTIEKKLSIGAGTNNPKVKYIDGFLCGSAVGYLAVVAMMKYGYLANVQAKFKLYATLAGGVMGAYLIYRNNASKSTKKVEVTTKSK